MSMLLTLLLAAPPVLWRYPTDGEAEPAALEAAVAPLASRLPDHLPTAATRDAWLAAPAAPGPLPGCFTDTGVCTDLDRAVLEALGLGGRIDARARRQGAGWEVRLEVVSTAAHVAPRTLVGLGDTLNEAAENVVSELIGLATLRVTVEPPTARLYAGALLLGTGPGSYLVPPGTTDVRAEADGHAPATVRLEVAAGDAATLTFSLPAVSARVALRFNPENAKVTLDHLPFADRPGTVALAPGKHLLRVEAPGFESYERTIEVAAGDTLEVTYDLKPKADLGARYAHPHPDTTARAFYGRAALRTTRVFDGPVELGSGILRVEKTSESAQLGGLDVGVGWRGELFEVEALGLAWLGGADPHTAVLPQDRVGLLTDLERWVIRPLWVGVRWPRWRIDPFVRAGVSMVLESFTARGVLDPAGNRAKKDHDLTLWLFGVEAGCRAQLDRDLFVQLSGSYEGWSETRSQASFQLGLGWTFDLLGGGGAK
jgi:hypothetical protein